MVVYCYAAQLLKDYLYANSFLGTLKKLPEDRI
jgi:hypothetical protein